MDVTSINESRGLPLLSHTRGCILYNIIICPQHERSFPCSLVFLINLLVVVGQRNRSKKQDLPTEIHSSVYKQQEEEDARLVAVHIILKTLAKTYL